MLRDSHAIPRAKCFSANTYFSDKTPAIIRKQSKKERQDEKQVFSSGNL